MAIGGEVNDTNTYSTAVLYHLSNSMLSRIQTTGAVTIGADSTHSVADVFIFGALMTSSANVFTLSSSLASIIFVNESSVIAMTEANSELLMKASANISVDSNLSITTTGYSGSVIMEVDSDCTVSDGDNFIVSSQGSLSVNTSAKVVVSSPGVIVDGVFDVTNASALMFHGTHVYSQRVVPEVM